jgi:hypothetical protein
MIVLHQIRPEDPRTDRIKIKKEEVLMAYSIMAAELPAYPLMPQYGFGAKSPYGDWYVYNDYDLCEQFSTACVALEVQTGDGQTVHLKVTSQKLTVDKIKEGQIGAKQIDVMSLHIGVRVPNGPLFRYIQPQMLIEYFKSNQFRTLKQSRGGVKFNGERIRNAGLGGEMIHLNIRPYDGDILGAYYPPQIEIMVKGTRQFIDYVIYDHPEINGLLCPKTCHRYKAVSFQQLNALGKVPRSWCICDEKQPRPGPSRGAGSSANSGTAAFLAALGAQQKAKGNAHCKHFQVGKCHAVGGKGAKCAFLHEGAPEKINCELGSQCKGPPRCKYLHASPDELMYARPPAPLIWEPD